tara:strand:+ start:480 stop:653 length:174 start_codon:yes stop_codon:yes gene_type:complete
MNENDERIPLNVNLTEDEKKLCDASYSEIILYYLTKPTLFLNHLYGSITTFTWKFDF